MVMALSTTDCQSEPHGTGGRNAIKDAIDSKLLWINAPFLIDLCVAVKASSNTLFISCVRQQVAG